MNLQQNVGPAVPLPIFEGTLHDSVDAGAHGIYGASDCLSSVLDACEVEEMTTGAFQRLDVLALVLQATGEESLKDRIVEVRAIAFPARFAQLQSGAMSAVQEIGEVRRRKNKFNSDLSHV
jgi:hypothetical protein